jgi:hypothetical protein
MSENEIDNPLSRNRLKPTLCVINHYSLSLLCSLVLGSALRHPDFFLADCDPCLVVTTPLQKKVQLVPSCRSPMRHDEHP